MFPTEDLPELGPSLFGRGIPIPADVVNAVVSSSSTGASAANMLDVDGKFVAVIPVGITLSGGNNLEITSLENAMFLHRDNQERMALGFLLMEKLYAFNEDLPASWWEELNKAIESRNALRRSELNQKKEDLLSKIDEIDKELGFL